MTGFGNFEHSFACDEGVHPVLTDVYLLDASYTVCGATVSGREAPIGQDLFALFAINSEERQALCEYLWNPQDRNLLLLSAPVPLLVVGNFFLQAGVFVILVPSGRVAEILHTSVHFERLAEHLYSTRGVSCTAEDYNVRECEAALRWYRAATAPFCCMQESFGLESVAATCALCADRLAQFFVCRLEYDLGGMGVRPEDRLLPEFYTAVLTAAMLSCQRGGRVQALKMFAQRCYGVGPVMYVRMWLQDGRDPLPEFSAIERAARSRGVFFDICPSGALEGETDIRVSLCSVDLCTVGVKELGAIPAGRCVFDLIPQETPVSRATRLALEGFAEMNLT